MSRPADDPRVPGEGEVPGDTNAGDIVGPTGEEMPVQTHDGVDGTQPTPDSQPRRAGHRQPIRPDAAE